MSNEELLQHILTEIEEQEKDFINMIPDGDYLRGNINFAVLVKNILKKHMQNPPKDWILISDRLPTHEEYCKNDGRFLVDDGNRKYQCHYDIYTEQFVHISDRDLSMKKDTCVLFWRELPERDETAKSEWKDMSTPPNDKDLCICINKFGSHMPFIAQFRKYDASLSHCGYFLDLHEFNETEDYQESILLPPMIERWKHLSLEPKDKTEVINIIKGFETTNSRKES